MHGYVGLISDRAVDFDFVKRITDLAPNQALEFEHLKSSQAIENFVKTNPAHILFWDADSPNGEEYLNPLNTIKISSVLSHMSEPERVIALSSQPLSETPQLKTIAPIGHSLLRNFEDPSAEISYRLIKGILAPDPFGLSQYFPEGTKIQSIVIKESAEKRAAIDAIQNVLDKNKIPTRLSAIIAQATDELMLNAMFAAPRTFTTIGKTGTMQVQTKIQKDRGDDLFLSLKETISMDIAFTKSYLAIAVSDNFGGLKKDDVFPYLRKDFSKSGVKTNSLGVGIGGIIQSGLSLLFVARPNHRTQAMIFVPVTENFRAFRSCFRLFGFIQR